MRVDGQVGQGRAEHVEYELRSNFSSNSWASLGPRTELSGRIVLDDLDDLLLHLRHHVQVSTSLLLERREVVHHLVLQDGSGLEYVGVRQLGRVLQHFKHHGPSLVHLREFNQFLVRQSEQVSVKVSSRVCRLLAPGGHVHLFH